MSRYFFLLPLIAILLSSCGSPASVSSFYQEHKRKAGVKNMTIPGWLIYAGTGIAHDLVDDEDTKAMLQLAKKVKRLQFMIAEEQSPISPADIQTFVHNARADHFEELIVVRDKSTTVNVMVREKGEKLRHLLFLINDESDFVFLNMRTNIKMKDIAKIVDYFLEKEGWDNLQKKSEKKKEEKPKV